MGESCSEPRGVKGSKEDQVRSGPSLEAVSRRIRAKIGIGAAYVVLEGRPVTLWECMVSSGGAGVVSPLMVMVVIMLVVVVMVVLVVVMVVGARQTQHSETRGPEGGRLRLGQMEPAGLSSSCGSAAPISPPQKPHPQEGAMGGLMIHSLGSLSQGHQAEQRLL